MLKSDEIDSFYKEANRLSPKQMSYVATMLDYDLTSYSSLIVGPHFTKHH